MDLKHIGARCREVRIARGLKQTDVADQLGCSSMNISAFECGRNNNAHILAWYIRAGQALGRDILEEQENGTN